MSSLVQSDAMVHLRSSCCVDFVIAGKAEEQLARVAVARDWSHLTFEAEVVDAVQVPARMSQVVVVVGVGRHGRCVECCAWRQAAGLLSSIFIWFVAQVRCSQTGLVDVEAKNQLSWLIFGRQHRQPKPTKTNHGRCRRFQGKSY